MKSAVIYARYSSERQTEQSIEGQLRICKEYAERNDYVIVDTYIDRAMTGTNDNRTNFQRMLRDSSKRAWDVVLVYKLDRFSRNKYEMAMHRKTLRDNGIKLVSAMENIPDTPEGIILESLLEGMAEYYSAELSQKVRRGMNESRQKGTFTGGHILYGYKVENKKVFIDEDQAEVIRYIYSEYANGVIVKDIIAALTENGIFYKGKPFLKNHIHGILSNEKYSGVFHHGEEVFDNTFPQIVPTEIFERVRKKVQDNKYGKRSKDTVYLLRFKMVCGYCGKPITSETGTARSGETKRYYKCRGRKFGTNCKKSMIRKDLLEELIINATLTAFQQDGIIEKLADMILVANEKRVRDQSVINILLKEQRETQKAIDNMLSAIEQGIITASTKRRLDELEEKVNRIAASLLLEQTKERITLKREDIIEFLTTAIQQEPQRMLDLLIKQIVFYDDKIEITYNYTDKGRPDDEHQAFSFYTNSVTWKTNPYHFGKEVTTTMTYILFI